MSTNLHLHKDLSLLNLAVGKQAAALLRLALVSGGAASLILSGDPELEGILSYLATSEGIEWGKVQIFSVCEFLGVDRNSRGSLQATISRKLLPGIVPAAGLTLIRGEQVPSTEIKRLSDAVSKHAADVVILAPGANGEVGMIHVNHGKDDESSGYYLTELTNEFRDGQVHPNRFRTIKEIPERGITIAMGEILKAKNILCCISGKEKSSQVQQLLEGTKNKTPFYRLKNHPSLHLHLDQEAAESLPPALHP